MDPIPFLQFRIGEDRFDRLIIEIEAVQSDWLEEGTELLFVGDHHVAEPEQAPAEEIRGASLPLFRELEIEYGRSSLEQCALPVGKGRVIVRLYVGRREMPLDPRNSVVIKRGVIHRSCPP